MNGQPNGALDQLRIMAALKKEKFFALSQSGSVDDRVREEDMAPPPQRRKLQSVRARMDTAS